MASLIDMIFTGLRADLANWIHRSDLTNTDYGNFIWLAECKLNDEMRNREMIGSTANQPVNGFITHPSDWREWKSITIVIGQQRYALQPLSEEQASVTFGDSTNGMPRGYVVGNTTTKIVPAGSASAYTYENIYWAGIPNLGQNGVTGNWLLTNHPQLYLYSALLEATAYVGDDPRIPLWKSARDEALDKLEKASKNALLSGAVLQMRPDRAC